MPKIDEKTLENEVRKIISDIVEIETEKITIDANFVEDLGMDSMMALEILGTLEKKYKLIIPEENLTKMTNLTQVLKIINQFSK
ncbi:MAG: acyl carrier protein [Candidatus Omnitrophica bacterium]|nr:acyl carrier protein [Candidatus Omnitrophota bacterium]